MKKLLIVLFMVISFETSKYSLTFLDGTTVTFDILPSEMKIDEGEWTLCSDTTYNKYEKVYKNTEGEFIGKLDESYYLKFNNKESLLKTLSNEVVLFRSENSTSLHPFLLLDKKEVDFVKKNFTLFEFELHRKGGTFNECLFYKLNDGRVLSIDKQGYDGELFRNTDDLLAYYNFIEGFDFKIILGVKNP